MICEFKTKNKMITLTVKNFKKLFIISTVVSFFKEFNVLSVRRQHTFTLKCINFVFLKNLENLLKFVR